MIMVSGRRPTSTTVRASTVLRTPLVALGALGVLCALTGCTATPDRLVDVPTTRAPAAVVSLTRSPPRCPSDTVLLGDVDVGSGAGAIPAGFDGRVLLRCQVDYPTMTTRAGRDRFTVRQWQGELTTELRAALSLPDREYASGEAACGSSTGFTTAVYVVDAHERAVRVLPPNDGPCHDVRADVETLLPDDSGPPQQTFVASRPAA